MGSIQFLYFYGNKTTSITWIPLFVTSPLHLWAANWVSPDYRNTSSKTRSSILRSDCLTPKCSENVLSYLRIEDMVSLTFWMDVFLSRIRMLDCAWWWVRIQDPGIQTWRHHIFHFLAAWGLKKHSSLVLFVPFMAWLGNILSERKVS